MIRVHQTFGVHAGRRLDFTQDQVRFGRLPDNDVVFDPSVDLDASGRHAEIVREGDAYVLVDLGSRNGTFVKGAGVKRLELRGGEEIEFGPGGPRVRVEILSLAGLPPAEVFTTPPARVEQQATPAEEPDDVPITIVRDSPPPSSDRFLRLAVAVLVVGFVIAAVAAAVLLGPKD